MGGGRGQSNSFSGGKKVPCNLHPHGDDLGVSVGLLARIRCDDLADESDKNAKCKRSNHNEVDPRMFFQCTGFFPLVPPLKVLSTKKLI